MNQIVKHLTISDANNVNVASHTITLNDSNLGMESMFAYNGNYEVSAYSEGTYDVVKRQVTVKIGTLVEEYNGKNVNLSNVSIISDAVLGDESIIENAIKPLLNCQDRLNAGVHDITCDNYENVYLSNYEIKEVIDGTLEITARKVVIAVNTCVKAYGTGPLTQNEISYEVYGLVSGESLNISEIYYNIPDSTEKGTYDISIFDYDFSNENYEVTNVVSGTLIIY